jgi:hypothetical protein
MPRTGGPEGASNRGGTGEGRKFLGCRS